MKSVDAHVADILALVEPLTALPLQLLDAQGCALAEDVRAPADLPPFDNSSMDGYAVLMDDVVDAEEDKPVTLQVVGDIAAGSNAAPPVRQGRTARIMTGAPMPAGAEAIVPVEWTDRGMSTVEIRRAPRPGQFIRHRGEDVTADDVVLAAGTYLGPAQIGLLAAIGQASVAVRPRPRVVVLSTGSELVEPGSSLAHGQICESNSFMLTAAARDAGAQVYRVGIVPDDPRTLMSTIEDHLIRADLVLTSGGVSAGAYDVVKEVLSELGTVTFESVAMQPGMPQGFGTVGPDSTPIVTLPGNPVSAFVSFELFVRPAIRRMLGAQPLHRPIVGASCEGPLTSPDGKRQYRRGWLERVDGRMTVRPVGGPGSHLLGDLAQANGLIVVPEDVTAVHAGSTVDVVILERRQS